jgi:hypothetical protein
MLGQMADGKSGACPGMEPDGNGRGTTSPGHQRGEQKHGCSQAGERQTATDKRADGRAYAGSSPATSNNGHSGSAGQQEEVGAHGDGPTSTAATQAKLVQDGPKR